MRLGEILREAREQRGLSLDDVERAIKIRKKYLQALEEESFRALPAPVYARGFLRSYAAYLGLDPQEVLALCPYQPDPVPLPPPISLHSSSSSRAITWLLAFAALLGLALLAAYLYGGEAEMGMLPEEPAAAAPLQVPSPVPTLAALPTPTFTPAPTPTPTPTPAPPRVEVAVKVTARSWVAVAVDGKADFSGILTPGEARTWVGHEKVSLQTGNAGGLEITFNGKPQGPLGRLGQVLNAEWGPGGVTITTPTPAPRLSPTATPSPTPSPPSGP